MRQFFFVFLIIAGVIISSSLSKSQDPYVSRVIDGDTFVTRDLGSVRIYGIDTPEKGECFYKPATKFLKSMIANKNVKIVRKGIGIYGRDIARVFIDDVDVGKQLVRKGYADIYYKDTSYRPDKRAAKSRQAGLWGVCE